ncbi:MAG: hypothetical protein AAF974_09130 [Cyanobacteria bacterium P01_E01_bin.34]
MSLIPILSPAAKGAVALDFPVPMGGSRGWSLNEMAVTVAIGTNTVVSPALTQRYFLSHFLTFHL